MIIDYTNKLDINNSHVEIHKNRNREKYTFANINLLGKCNANCYFCLGKDIEDVLLPHNQLETLFPSWKNFEYFLNRCREENIKKLYLTGQTADGLQYNYLNELIHFLQDNGFLVGVRTNGYLAKEKIKSINNMKEEIGYSIQSLIPERNKIIMGRSDIPDWEYIIPKSGDNVRVSIVFTRYNMDEILDIIKYCSKFRNVKYIQLRRISTDTRVSLLQPDIDLFEAFVLGMKERYKEIGNFYGAEIYEIFGKPVSIWRTVETSCNSLNYFTDGTCSDEYFIIEGYMKDKS